MEPLPQNDFREALAAYGAGQVGAEAVAAFARDYRGPCGHFLWDHDGYCGGRWYIYDCFDILSGPKMAELTRALLVENPGFLAVLSPELGEDLGRRTFLSVALELFRQKSWECQSPQYEGSTSVEVLILLAVPGTTRHPGHTVRKLCPRQGQALHDACRTRWIHPALVHHLIDLDPDVLMLEDDNHLLPLEWALLFQGRDSRFVPRMMELRPASLRHVSLGPPDRYPCPSGYSFWRQPVLMSIFDMGFVSDEHLKLALSLAPESVRRGTSRTHSTALEMAITNHPDPGLVKALIEAYPPSLCLARAIDTTGTPVSGSPLLPHERAATGWSRGFEAKRLVPLLRGEFLRAALAVVEHLHFATGLGGCPAAAAFQRSVQENVEAALSLAHASPHAPLCSSAVVRAIRDLPDEKQVDLLSSLFRRREDAVALARDDAFRDAVMGETVMGLSRLNRHGGNRAEPSPGHQVQLLALASDTGSLECAYLQLRQYGLPLVQHSSSTSLLRQGAAASASAPPRGTGS